MRDRFSSKKKFFFPVAVVVIVIAKKEQSLDNVSSCNKIITIQFITFYLKIYQKKSILLSDETIISKIKRMSK